MGLFDALKKLANAAADIVEDVTDEANDLLSSAEKNITATVAANTAAPSASADQTLLATANQPAKPSVERETCFYGGENADDEYLVRFMLSGDFVEFNSHCEWCPSYQYEPDCTDDYTGYQAGLPAIFFGPVNKAYDAAERYLATKAQSGREFAEINNGTFLFRTKLPLGDDIICAYVFAPGTPMEKDVLALTYPAAVEGTPLEKKLMAALEEAAETYTETLNKD